MPYANSSLAPWATELDAFTQEVGIEFVEIDPGALRGLQETAQD